MIDNFAIAFFTVCIIYTAYRAIKLERSTNASALNADKQMESQQQQSLSNDDSHKNLG